MHTFVLRLLAVLGLLGAAGIASAQEPNFTGGTLTASYTAYAILDDQTGAGPAVQPAWVQLRDLDSSTVHTINIGGLRTGSTAANLPSGWRITGSWSNVAGDNSSLRANPRQYSFRITLPAGRYLVTARSGAYVSRYTYDPRNGDPLETVEITDSYVVSDLILSGDGLAGGGSPGDPGSPGGGTTPAPSTGLANATYSVTWTAATAGNGGNVVNLGNSATITVPAEGGLVSVTATVSTNNGGVVRRMRIYSTRTGTLLSEVSGTTGAETTLSASTSLYIDQPDQLRAVATVDGRMGTLNGTTDGIAFSVNPESGYLRYMVQFRMVTDTDGQYSPIRLAPMVIKNSSNQTVFTRNLTAGIFPVPTRDYGIVFVGSMTGGYALDFSNDFMMIPGYDNVGVLPPGDYTISVGRGHVFSQELNNLGNGDGRMHTMDWSPGDVAIIGRIDQSIAAAVLLAAAPITPTPTPITSEPPDIDAPLISWGLPVADPGYPAPLSQTVSCGTTITIRADARDDTDLARIEVREVSDPMGVTNAVPNIVTQTFPARARAGSASTTLFVQYIPHAGFANRTYEYTAQAWDRAGNASNTIRLIVIGIDTVIPSSRINAIIVSAAATPDQALRGDIRLQGGIIAIGDPGTVMEAPGNMPTWFRPEERYLTGEWIPPVIPWFIDLRISDFKIKAKTGVATDPTELPSGRPAGRPAPPRPTPAPVPNSPANAR